MKIKEKINKFKLSWIKLIVFAIVLGIYTGLMASIPALKDTSFADITISFEVWILIGIFIIVYSKSPKDSALKCFIFFLISQPLVYLFQIVFAGASFSIFGYYKPWFIWTILTLPMGFIGYYIKKDKWWGLIILFPILVFLGIHYGNFLKDTLYMFPHHLLSTIFCAITLLVYPLWLFKNKKIKITGTIISILIIIVMSIFSFTNRIVYSTYILTSGGNLDVTFDDSYKVSLSNPKLGNVEIRYSDEFEDFLVNGEFKKGGKTVLTLEDKDGNKKNFDLVIDYNKYSISER